MFDMFVLADFLGSFGGLIRLLADFVQLFVFSCFVFFRQSTCPNMCK